jgi:hypothetical protein
LFKSFNFLKYFIKSKIYISFATFAFAIKGRAKSKRQGKKIYILVFNYSLSLSLPSLASLWHFSNPLVAHPPNDSKGGPLQVLREGLKKRTEGSFFLGCEPALCCPLTK